MPWPDGGALRRHARSGPFPASTRWLLALVGLLGALLSVSGCAWPWQGGLGAPATPTPQFAGGEPVLPQLQVLDRAAPAPPPDAPNPAQSWPLAGADPANTFAAPASAIQGVVRWFFQTPGPALAAPVVSGGLALVSGGDGALYAVDVRSGALRWRAPLGDTLVAGTPAIAGGHVFVAVAGHGLAMLDLATGAVRWIVDTRSPVRAPPLVDGSLLFVAAGSNSLLCLDQASGAEYWAFKSEDAFAAFWPTAGQPAVTADDGGRVFVALGASTEFDALDARTGRKVWEYTVAARMVGAPVYNHQAGLVYVATWSGQLYTLDAHTGKLRWQYAVPGAGAPGVGFGAGPALGGATLLLADYHGGVTALDAASGAVRWTRHMGAAITATPLACLAGGTLADVFIADEQGRLSLLDGATGAPRRQLILGELRAPPVLADGLLFVASAGDRGLFALH